MAFFLLTLHFVLYCFKFSHGVSSDYPQKTATEWHFSVTVAQHERLQDSLFGTGIVGANKYKLTANF